MTHLLNLLAAIALLVWGTHLVRAGVLQVFGANLRALLGRSTGNRFTAALSGLGVTALVQSSTATSLMTASFVGQGLIALPAALAVMLGADVGTALMSVLFSLDLSWLSPLFLLVGIVLFLARHDTMLGRLGRVLIGLGLILLALRLVVQASAPLLAAPLVRTLLAGLGSDLPTELLLGAGLAVMAYSSLAIVLLLATMVASQVLPTDIALGVVLGANLGSGVLAVLTTLQSAASVRQVTVGNLVFKLLGVALVAPWLGLWLQHVHPLVGDGAHSVVLFHLAFNLAASLCFLGATDALAQALVRWIPEPTEAAGHAPPRLPRRPRPFRTAHRPCPACVVIRSAGCWPARRSPLPPMPATCRRPSAPCVRCCSSGGASSPSAAAACRRVRCSSCWRRVWSAPCCWSSTTSSARSPASRCSPACSA